MKPKLSQFLITTALLTGAIGLNLVAITTPTASQAAPKGWHFVTKKGNARVPLNVRTAPWGKVIGTLPTYSNVQVDHFSADGHWALLKARLDVSKGGWVPMSGWVAAEYLVEGDINCDMMRRGLEASSEDARFLCNMH